MRYRFQYCFLILAALGAAAPARADGPLTKPILMLQIAPGEGMLDRAEYIAKLALADKEDQLEGAKQFLGAVRAMAGEDGKDGIDGIDMKKPIVVYAGLAADGSMPFAVMVPVVSETALINALKNRLGVDPKVDGDRLYTAKAPVGGQDLYARFANGYAYVTVQNKGNIDLKVLPLPEQVVGRETGLLSLSVKVANIPKMFRDLAMGQLETQLSTEKAKENPNDPPELRQFKPAMIDGVAGALKQFLYETDALRVNVDVDPKSDDLSFALELVPLKGSAMAAYAAGLNAKKTVAGPAVDPACPLAFHLNAALPDALKAALSAMVDKGIQDGIEKAQPETRGEAERFLRSLEPTLKSGVIDFAVGARVIDRKLNVTLAVRTVKGGEIEKSVKQAVAKAPEEVRGYINLDADAVDGVNLHELKVGSLMEESGRRVLGESSIWFAVRDNLLVASVGPDAKGSVQKGLLAKAGQSSPMHLKVGVRSVTPFLETERERKAAADFAREIFDKTPGSDAVSVGFEGGESVKVKFAIKGTLIRFFAKLDAAKKGE